MKIPVCGGGWVQDHGRVRSGDVDLKMHSGHIMMTFFTSFRAEKKPEGGGGGGGDRDGQSLLSVSRNGCTLCRASLSMAF